ncbi:MAG TPA: NAD-dependent epimerase/dehydratase family protein [Candidatus Nanoarchaeia archaeon]|nr:NAD-dependent epimerase/dehydratase family protein [Candidatus Nanoarchaeia archaeon]
MGKGSCVVSGAGGFLGKFLVSGLLEKGMEVKAFAKRQPEIKNSSVSIMQADISKSLLEFKDDVKGASCMFHLAAVANIYDCIADIQKCLDSNVTGTVNLLELCKESEIKKFVFASSCSVYGNAKVVPTDEESALSPLEPFSASKIAAEKFIESYSKLYGIDFLVFRIFNLYGPSQTNRIIPHLVKSALNSNEIKVRNCSVTRDYIHAKDVTDAFLNFSESKSGTYNLGSGVETSIKDIAEKLGAILKKKITVHETDKNTGAEIKRSCADMGKMKKDFRWAPKISIDEGLSEAVAKIRQNS